jgi:hypothetical protein
MNLTLTRAYYRRCPPLGRDGSLTECVHVFERDGRLMFESRFPALGECTVDAFGGAWLETAKLPQP